MNIIHGKKKVVITYSSTQSYTGYCAPNQTGGPITLSATATSIVSQGDADAKALAAATAAVNAALSTTCVLIDSSTTPAWQFDPTTEVCDISSDKRPYRDSKAKMKDANPLSPSYNTYRNNGALYAYRVSSPTCPNAFTSVSYSITFTKTNCPGGTGGSTDVLTVPAGAFLSLIGQGEADLKAYTYLNQNGNGIYNGTILPENYPPFDNEAIEKNFPVGTCPVPETGEVQPTLAKYTLSSPSFGFVVVSLSRALNNDNQLILSGSVGIFSSAGEQVGTGSFSMPSGVNTATASTSLSIEPWQASSYYARVTSVNTTGYTPSTATMTLTT